MLAGVAFALAAGIMWGLVFVGPLLLPEYPAALQAFGRYLAFGLIAIPLAWLDRSELARMARADWIEALKLAAIGNILYYLCLASAIQRAGGPLPTMIIGTLPVVISIAANLLNHQRDGRLPWGRLAPCLATILAGIACVNQVELEALSADPSADVARYASGALLATAQGLATLPLAVTGYVAFWGWTAGTGNAFPMPFGPRPLVFVGLMLAIGLFASWLGTHCWNEASQRLPTALVGQLIVFETLSALSYAYLLRGQWPQPLTLAGVGLLLVGVAWAVRIKPQHAVVPEAHL